MAPTCHADISVVILFCQGLCLGEQRSAPYWAASQSLLSRDSLDSASPVAILETCHQEAWGVLLCSERPVGVLILDPKVPKDINRLQEELNS